MPAVCLVHVHLAAWKHFVITLPLSCSDLGALSSSKADPLRHKHPSRLELLRCFCGDHLCRSRDCVWLGVWLSALWKTFLLLQSAFTRSCSVPFPAVTAAAAAAYFGHLSALPVHGARSRLNTNVCGGCFFLVFFHSTSKRAAERARASTRT